MSTLLLHHLAVSRLEFQGCCFRHEFPGQGKEILPLCGNREDTNLGCAHVKDLKMKGAIHFLTTKKIVTEAQEKKILDFLGIVNIELGSLDIWSQELSSLLRDVPRLNPAEFRLMLKKQGLSPEIYLASPELLREAPKEFQEIATRPKVYLRDQLILIYTNLLEHKFLLVTETVDKLMWQINRWLNLDEISRRDFKWTNSASDTSGLM